jgi:hypothetical protein
MRTSPPNTSLGGRHATSGLCGPTVCYRSIKQSRSLERLEYMAQWSAGRHYGVYAAAEKCSRSGLTVRNEPGFNSAVTEILARRP